MVDSIKLFAQNVLLSFDSGSCGRHKMCEIVSRIDWKLEAKPMRISCRWICFRFVGFVGCVLSVREPVSRIAYSYITYWL